jgi:hypothetical protein
VEAPVRPLVIGPVSPRTPDVAAGCRSDRTRRRTGCLGRSNLCVGLASVKQNEGLTLQPFTVPGTTVWVVQTDLAIPPGYSPSINAATTDSGGPLSLHLPRNEVASGKPLQMQARHLQFLTGENTRSGAAALWRFGSASWLSGFRPRMSRRTTQATASLRAVVGT